MTSQSRCSRVLSLRDAGTAWQDEDGDRSQNLCSLECVNAPCWLGLVMIRASQPMLQRMEQGHAVSRQRCSRSVMGGQHGGLTVSRRLTACPLLGLLKAEPSPLAFSPTALSSVALSFFQRFPPSCRVSTWAGGVSGRGVSGIGGYRIGKLPARVK